MNRSYAIAGVIFGLISLYLLAGMTGCGQSTPAPSNEVAIDDSLGKAVMTVRVREMDATEIAREIVVPGRTDAARRVVVRAETGGTVVAIPASRGETVEADSVLLRLDPDTRPEAVARAEAQLAARRIDFEAAKRLESQQLASPSALADANTAVAAAEEALSMARLDLRRTQVTAPFRGVMNEHLVEIGDYVQPGDPVAVFLELDPLIISGEVTELQVAHVKVGERGVARLSDHRELEGRIRFVDTDADPESRTFTVELEVPNPGGAIPAGRTAQIVVETERVPAFEISTAHVSIDDEGHFGIKFVDENDIVRFAEIQIVRTTPRTVWLTGLPDHLRLITVGQGFTQPGDAVNVVEDTSTWE